MKAYIAKNALGVFAFDENGKLIEKILFPRDVETKAEKLSSKCKEEEMIVRKLRGYEIDRSVGNKAENILREQSRNLALKFKIVENNIEYNKMLSGISILLTKEKLRVTKTDRILMQAIGMLDETDRVINVFVERLREWYGMYFPEAERQLTNHELFAKTVCMGERSNIEDKAIKDFAKDTQGMEFSDDDIEEMSCFAKEIVNLFERRKSLEKYITKSAKSVIPNMAAVAGPLLAARLLSLAGGLRKASRMASSSIQLLGAEKALFRHLKGGGKAPKYGILFSHPYVQQAQKEKKGKIARLVAAKLSIAAKTDFFSKDDHGKELADKLEKQVKNV